MTGTPAPRIGIIMGSDSDWPIMQEAARVCASFGIAYEVRVLSAHRTPTETSAYASSAASRGLQVLIAGAGGAAHLAGALAAQSRLPVLGVPIPATPLAGLDALLSTVQMPRGIPVATVGISRADNAALLALQILALQDRELAGQMERHRADLANKAHDADRKLQARAAPHNVLDTLAQAGASSPDAGEGGNG
jgi:5-(carboxyamino)imidazole ribonucleotide mutase